MINLLEDLQKEIGLTYLFIAHDLRMVRHISDRVAVMYLGKIVEMADRRTSFTTIRSTPTPRPCFRPCRCPTHAWRSSRQRIILTGDLPTPVNPPSGCRFHTRCPWRLHLCGAAGMA